MKKSLLIVGRNEEVTEASNRRAEGVDNPCPDGGRVLHSPCPSYYFSSFVVAVRQCGPEMLLFASSTARAFPPKISIDLNWTRLLSAASYYVKKD